MLILVVLLCHDWKTTVDLVFYFFIIRDCIMFEDFLKFRGGGVGSGAPALDTPPSDDV